MLPPPDCGVVDAEFLGKEGGEHGSMAGRLVVRGMSLEEDLSDRYVVGFKQDRKHQFDTTT